MEKYTGKTISKITDGSYFDNETVAIHFTDGTKIEIVGLHDYDYVSLKIIEDE